METPNPTILDTTNSHIYNEVMSNRLLLILILTAIFVLQYYTKLSHFGVFLITMIAWAIGDGIIHYRKKIMLMWHRGY